MKTQITHFDQMRESFFLSWFDTSEQGERVTIRGYEQIEIERDNGQKEKKWLIYFQEKEKGMLLNNTNRNILSQLFNGDVKGSIGKQIILFYRDDIEFKGVLMKGLRIKGCLVQQKPLRENETINPTESKIA